MPAPTTGIYTYAHRSPPVSRHQALEPHPLLPSSPSPQPAAVRQLRVLHTFLVLLTLTSMHLDSARLPSAMARAAAPHSSPPTWTQMASPFTRPALASKADSRNTSVLCHSGCHNKPLPPVPDESQQEEVFDVSIVNESDFDDDGKVTIKCAVPERWVEWIGRQEMANEQHAVIERPMGVFQSPYPMRSPSPSLCQPFSFGRCTRH